MSLGLSRIALVVRGLLFCGLLFGSVVRAAERPNILWISCEDISAHLGCYGDAHATTPNLDRLASEGTLYTRAFTCHGVCAPCRTGIITGMYPISLGANHMRSKVPLPPEIRLFPALLRQAGYYCTNNSKTDYNLIWDQQEVWDESSRKAHYRNRGNDQPFFAVFNLTMTHESKIWPSGWEGVVKDLPESERHSADGIEVPPIYPNTRTVREDFARLADLITVMDRRVGQLLRELQQSGLAEDTIVIFWSDHGDGLPRAKRWTYDSGTLVPMISRVPAKYRDLAGDRPPGSRDERMINLIDLGPTVLHLAGVPVPENMHGRPFLGPDQHDGHLIYGARDRLDERHDLVRMVRNERYRYVRNLMPWYPALQHINYSERNETRKEMRRLYAEGALPAGSAQWLKRRRPEELYDLSTDPWETKNLIDDPALQDVVTELRSACDEWQLGIADAQLLPEPMLDREGKLHGTRSEIFAGSEGRERLRRVLRAAISSAAANGATLPLLGADEPDAAVRWWNAEAISRAVTGPERLADLRAMLRDEDVMVRISGISGLSRAGEHAAAAEGFLRELEQAKGDDILRHWIIRELDEAAVEVLQICLPKIDGDGATEYFKRLREHASSRLAAR